MRCASLSVGIIDYADRFYLASEMRLRYAVADAEAFHRYVSLAWPSTSGQHVLLRNGEAVIEQLSAAIASFDAPLDLFFLYLSGHGETGPAGSGWFCLADAEPSIPSFDGAAIDRCLAGVNADSIIVFIDCCHAEAVVAASRSFFVHPGRTAQVVAASCRADQRAWEDDGLKRSIFSDVLLRALSTDSPLANARGEVDFQARLLPYLRDQVPVAAAAKKRGQVQEPIIAGFVSGLVTLPVVSTTSLGRPLTISQAIRAGVRRFLVVSLVTAIAAFAIADLMIFHLAVSGTGEIVVRPGFSATYSFSPGHLVSDLDTGVSIRDVVPTDDKMLSSLAHGASWGIATHRDVHGLKPWLSVLQPSLRVSSLKPLRVGAFGESPAFDVDDDQPPKAEALFLATLRNKSPSETGRAIYPYDPDLPWACTEQVSNKIDFTRLLAEPAVFRRDMEWLAATAPAATDERAKRIYDLVRLAAYRAMHEKDDEKRLTEFDAFAGAVARIAGPKPADGLRSAVSSILETTPGTWCSLHGAFAAAIAGSSQLSVPAEADLRFVLESYDRSKQGDLNTAEQSIAVHGLARLGQYRPLDPATLQLVIKMIKQDSRGISGRTPANELLTELALSQDLNSTLAPMLFENLRAETGPADFAPLEAANLLARNFRFLNSAQRTRVHQWIAAKAPQNKFQSGIHEAIGYVSLTEPVGSGELEILLARLPAVSRFPPQATNYRGETVIISSGDSAAVALGRVGQSQLLAVEATERLANFAASRPDLQGREEIISALARQWFGATEDLTNSIRKRLLRSGGDASRRALETEVAACAVLKLRPPQKEKVRAELAEAWSREVEPAQRIALAKLIALLAGN
jgi:hypothetical protein